MAVVFLTSSSSASGVETPPTSHAIYTATVYTSCHCHLLQRKNNKMNFDVWVIPHMHASLSFSLPPLPLSLFLCHPSLSLLFSATPPSLSLHSSSLSFTLVLPLSFSSTPSASFILSFSLSLSFYMYMYISLTCSSSECGMNASGVRACVLVIGDMNGILEGFIASSLNSCKSSSFP